MKLLSKFLIVSAFATLASCAKEGCTDPKSKNYDPDAKKSNNSCKYEGKITFWYNSATASDIVADGITSLKYYVDGELIGSSSASVYFTGAPNCGQTGTIGVTKDMGSSTSKSINYQVKDQDDEIVWQGTKSLEANVCVAMELTN